VKHLFYLNKYFLKYKWRLLLGIVFVTLSNYFRVRIPQVIREALNFVLEKIEENSADAQLADYSADLIKFSLIIIGVAMLMGTFMYLMRQTIIVMSRLIEYDLRKEIFTHYEKLDLSFFKRNKTGDLMSRISEDVSKVRMYLGPALLYGINLVSLFIIVIYAMVKVSPTLTLYTLLPLPFLSISIYLVSRVINRRSEIIQKELANLTSISQEVYSGIRIIKSYAKEKQFSKFFDKETDRYKEKSMDLAKVQALFFPLMIFLISISSLLTIYMGGVLVERGEISSGNIAEFIIYVNYLTWPFTAIGWIASIIQQAEASQKRINEILLTEPLIVNSNDNPTEIEGKIEFRNVSFIYPDTGIQALTNVSFTINPGEKVVLLGKTASGKSTIAELLLRMYDPEEGEILIDDINLKDINLDVLRRKIGYVPQDVFLFSDSIANNIAYGNQDASMENIVKYAEYAAVKKDIESLPESFQTVVGERGVTLSGGQKQRVSIARAFVKDPEIVIMDDSLSAVDTKTEKKILSYLNEALEDKTSIIITHRLFNLLNVDKILILENGKIIENGTHDELIKQKGVYNEMVENQSLDEIDA